MKYEEAIDILTYQALVLGRASGKSTLERSRIEALGKAVEAIEKQIPKKPIYNDYGYNGFDEFLPNCAKCPNCGREIPYGTWSYEDSHHCECGQALDWGEENK